MNLNSQMDYPGFAVVISLYKADNPAWVDQAVESIVNQTFKPNQIIITIDGEIPQTIEEVIAKYSDHAGKIDYHQIKSVTNVGRGVLLAKAVQDSSYELMAIMDSDDVCIQNRFEQQLNIFTSQPEVEVVGGWVDEFDADLKQYFGTRAVPEHHADIANFAKRRNPVNQMTVMFKKSAVIAAGNYQHHQYFEDMWLWSRMINNHSVFYNIQASLVRARAGTNMVMRRRGLNYLKSEFLLYVKLYKLGFLDLRKTLSNIIIRLPLRLLPGPVLSVVFRFALRSRNGGDY